LPPPYPLDFGQRKPEDDVVEDDKVPPEDLESTLSAEPLDSRPPERVGPYRILQKLGEGGMGEVYLAEQEKPIRRRVALKLIKLGMDTPQVIARFESERQALAIMNHPNVAKVFDAGATEQGRPYFVMEYIKGVPITEHCDRHRLSNRERLELFREVCEGVQHAHQNSIIHRDLKPSNVLVTEHEGKRLPKIIDFGVAKAMAQRLTEKTIFTELGVMIGTPEYMSPEQADLTGEDVDTRTDVYSLGVILYELLVSALPFDPKELRRGGFEGIRKRIREEEPHKPSLRLSTLSDASTETARARRVDLPTLQRQLRGDLDWITMKALEKDRRRRYSSASELAADIRRHLSDEPVEAGPPSASYRLGKFVRRHRLSVATVGVLLLGLTVGIAGTTVGMIRARRAAETAEQASRFLSDTMGSVNLERLGSGLQRDLQLRVEESAKRRGLSEEDTATLLEGFQAAMVGVNTVNAGLRLMDEEILARAGTRIEERLADEPLLAARLEHTLGWTYQELGLYDKAEPHSRRAVEIREQELGRGHPDTLWSMNNLGILYYEQGRYDETKPLWVETLATRKRVLGDDHPETLKTMSNLANLHLSLGQYDKAEPLYLEAIAAQKRSGGEKDLSTLRSMNNLAILYRSQGRYEEAEALYLETLALQKRAYGDEHPDTLNLMLNLANLYWGQGQYDKSDPLYLDVAKSCKRVLGDEHPDTLRAQSNLAESYKTQGRYDEAEALHLETIETKKRVLGEGHPDTLISLSNLSELYTSQGRYAEAEGLLANVLEARKSVLGDNHPDTLRSMNGLAWLLLTREPADSRDPTAALDLALLVAERTDYLDFSYLDTLSLAYHLTGNSAQAAENQKKAIALLPEGPSGARTALEEALAKFEAAAP
jgi:serine/threonine protein kinase/tetratricopeptide (TPR) repeat protein